MPPHCDSLDGPVVRAAQRALERSLEHGAAQLGGARLILGLYGAQAGAGAAGNLGRDRLIRHGVHDVLDRGRVDDVLALARCIQEAVRERFGVGLVPEPVCWGREAGRAARPAAVRANRGR